MTGCKHIKEMVPDCECYGHDAIDPAWQPEESHLLVVEEVERLVAKWERRLPWLAGWKLRVRPIPEGSGEWSMRIDTALYVKIASLEVRESVVLHDDILEDEHSVELMVLHELCHILFEQNRYIFMNWLVHDEEVPQPALLAMQDSEETAVWSLARALIALDAELADSKRDMALYQRTTHRLTEHVVRETRGKSRKGKEQTA